MSWRRALPLLALLGAACHKAPAGPVRLSVSIDPGYLQFTHAGDHLPLAAKAQDFAKKPVPDARFVWRSADTSVALVQDGVVTALKDGITRIWAVTGQDSSFAVAVVQLPHIVTLTLAPALAHFDALGDTTTLALTNPDSLVSPKAMCMADDDKVAVIDTSYHLHSVGNGTTLVRCRVGEAEGSMRVTVQQRIARVGIVTGLTRTLRIERDTIHLGLAKVDKKNTPMDVGTPTWRSLDTAIVAVDASSGVATGKVEGKGKVVALLNGFADTTELEVIAKEPTFVAARPMGLRAAQTTLRGTRGVPGGGGVRGTPNLGPRPVSTAIGVRDIVESDSVFQAQTLLPGHAESPLRLSLTVMSAEHEINDDVNVATGLRTTSGLLFGGEAELMPSPRFRIQAEGLFGTLAGKTAGTPDANVQGGSVDLGLGLFPWFWLNVGSGVRTYFDPNSGLQRWLTVRTGAEARFQLSGEAVQGYAAFTALPVVSISGGVVSPTGLIATAGLDYAAGKIALGARYSLERYDFPDIGGRKPREQFGTLRFRIGLNLGGK